MLSKYSVKRPFTVFVGVVAVIVIGIVAMMRMTMDLLPNMNLPYVLVITTDPGASPEAVESDVTSKLEASLATTSNLKNIQSMSYNSYSTVILEYEQSASMDATMIEIQQKIDQLDGSFDDKVGTPIVMQLDPDMMPVMVAAVGVEGMDNTHLTEYVKNEILPQLESIEGVASVSASGGVEEKIQITLDEEKIGQLNDKIMDDIDAQFAEKATALDASREQIEAGKNAVESGSQTLADETSSANTELQSTQIQLYNSSSDLSDKLDTLNAAAETLQSTIDTLQSTYDTTKGYADTLSTLQTLESLSVNSASGTGVLTDEQFPSAANGMSYDEVVAQIAALSSGISTANSEIAKSGSSLTEYGITLNTYEDIPSAVETLTTKLAETNAGIATVEAAQDSVEASKSTVEDAMTSLSKTQVISELEIAQNAAQLYDGESALDDAESQIESAKESTKSSADLNTILSVDMVKNILMAQNFEMPAGYASSSNGKYLVKVGEDVDSVEALEDMVLMDLNMDSVGVIKLSDVADVEVVDNSSEVYAKVNGNSGLLLSFEKQTGYATGDVTKAILKKFDSLKKTEEQKISFSTLMNQGVYINMIVKGIAQNMILGMVLAILVLLIFLRDIRPTIIISAAIPLSVIFAVVLMYFSHITLNIISMSGLTLGIGMLVDNSIVVIENIFRLRKGGMPIKKASVIGASQVGGAITASTLTTICVFLPIVFTEGLTRQLFVDMGLTIAFTLTASLIVALTLVPAMAQGLLRKAKTQENKGYSRFLNGYGKVLANVLRVKPLVFLVMIGLLVLSIFLSLSRGTEFMPEMDSQQVTVTMVAPDDTQVSFEDMTSYADTLMTRLQDIKDVKTVGAMMGTGTTLSLMSSSSSDTVTMYVLLKENTKMTNEKIKSEIKKASKDLPVDVSVETAMMDMSAISGSGISIMVKGRDMETLQRLASQAADILESTDGTTEVDDGLSDMTDQLVVKVDKAKAADYNLTVAQVYSAIQEKLADDTSATTISSDAKDLDVYVRTGEQAETTVSDIKKMKVEYTDRATQKTYEVMLSKIASFENVQEVSSILRDAQTRYINVTAQVKDGENVGLVGDAVEDKLKDMKIPEGYSVKLAGENETINEAMRQVMLMMLLAVILIYLIMVAQFQSLLSPFIIMFTIPLAFTGGFFTLYFAGLSVSVIAMVGFVMLSGIIVNNGIVLVDYINQLRREGMSKKEAILESAKTRLRPVLMTALTTIISMSTMAIGMGQGTEMAQPMAVVIVGGMVYGTLLTLIVVPCLYDAFNREKDMTEEDIELIKEDDHELETE